VAPMIALIGLINYFAVIMPNGNQRWIFIEAQSSSKIYGGKSFTGERDIRTPARFESSHRIA